MLRLNDKNQNLVALLCSTMPEDIRINLMRDLNTIYKNGVYAKDTGVEGKKNDFQSIHFSYYNRYSTRVFFPLFFTLYTLYTYLNTFTCREIIPL